MNKKLHRYIFYPTVLYTVTNFHLTIFFFQLFSRQRPENCFHWIISLRGDPLSPPHTCPGLRTKKSSHNTGSVNVFALT